MAVTRTTSVFRTDGGGGGGGSDDGKGSRKHCPRMGARAGGHRWARGSSGVEAASGAARRVGPAKFLLIGAVLAMQFIGAAAVSGKGERVPIVARGVWIYRSAANLRD